VAIHDGAYATVDLAQLTEGSNEIAVRVIRCLVDVFGGQAEPVRLSQIETLVDGFVVAARPHTGTVTLGGCIVERPREKARAAARGDERLHIYREPGRHGLPKVALQPGSGCFWDRRFYVSAGPSCEAPVQVTALSSGQFAELRRRFPGLAGLDLIRRAAVTLPAFWAGDQLLAVPYFAAEEPSLAGPKVHGSPLLAASFADQHVRAIYGGQRPGARADQAGAD
jgi:hypothetical protein